MAAEIGIAAGVGEDFLRAEILEEADQAAAGFAAAAAVVSETDRWWPEATIYVAPLMYGGAALIGVSRMYNNKHWASDVVMGAAIGTFAGLKVVRYHHSHPDNKIDEWLLGVTIRPGPDGGNTFRFWAVPRRD